MAETVLSIKHLNKSYGRIHAVNDLSIDVPRGSVFGILGPNGSGKTTTLGMLLNVISSDSGSFSWFGEAPSKQTRRRIGAILETPNFYPYLTAVRNLKITADIKGCAYDQIGGVLKRVGLYERRNDNFKTYSLGMKQRLAIGAALLNNPEILVLDEPTNGLDPQGIAEIRELIVRIAQEGVTILLASHLLDEVEKVCTDVAVLKKGQLLFTGKVDQVLGESETTLLEIAAHDLTELKEAFSLHPDIKSIDFQGNKLLLSFQGAMPGEAINGFAFERGITLSHLSVRKMSLEKQFLELTAE